MACVGFTRDVYSTGRDYSLQDGFECCCDAQYNKNLYGVLQYIKESSMIIDRVLAMKTNTKLLAAIEGVSHRQLSPGEIIEQRVSFVFGSMDAKNGVTREHVRQVILNQVGASEAVAG
jgi:hypothetical protein